MNMKGVYSEKIKIAATDVDFKNKWKLQSLLAYAQETANSQCEELGAGRDFLNDKCGAAFILARTYLEIKRYPKSSETVKITTWPKHGSRHILTRFFEIENEKGDRIASIVSHWAVMNLKERKLVSPADCGIAMPDTSEVPDLAEMPKRRSCNFDNSAFGKITAKYSDIDCLGHVNNTKYVQWVLDFLGYDFLAKNEIISVDIKYCREVLEGTEVLLIRSDEKDSDTGENLIFIKGISEKENTVYFETVLKYETI